jgi:hypothetical protein
MDVEPVKDLDEPITFQEIKDLEIRHPTGNLVGSLWASLNEVVMNDGLAVRLMR